MLEIQITEQGTNLAYVDPKGAKTCKGIDLGDLVKVLSSNVSLDLGDLPIGTRNFGIKGDQVHLVVERPAAEHEVSFQDSRVKKIGKVSLPAALFMFVLTKANDAYFVNKSHIFAMRQNHVQLGLDGLYAYPTPNVYEDARICWGHNDDATKNFKSLAAINGLIYRFFTAPFNNDLFRTQCVSKNFPWKDLPAQDRLTESYLEFLTTHPFNVDWLTPARAECQNYDKAKKFVFGSEVNL